ncbi:MAG: HesA/MoeB/ThiF family protein [Nitrospirota bacterium]
MFSQEELNRYNRQMLMGGWGLETQKKLKQSTVFIAGAGGLGSPASIYLAVAGIGKIRICDFDAIEWSNLNRQILHFPDRIGTNKALSAKKTLEELNPGINVIAFTDKIVSENVDAVIGDSDIVVDCMDNFTTRYILNEAAIRKGVPLVFGSIWGMEGRMSFIKPPETPCLKCIYPEAPPLETFPVIGATPGVIGSLQAIEVIKYLTGIGENLKGKIMVWDGRNVEFKNYKAYRDPECPVCSSIK